jgi:uncharacterized delta-60 repeat protein
VVLLLVLLYPQLALAKFGTNGTVTTDFGGTMDEAFSVIVQSDGKLVAAGATTQSNNDEFALARYNTDGSLDSSFGASGKVITSFSSSQDQALSVIQQADGKLVAAGFSQTAGDFALARYNVDGSLDTSFGANGKVNTPIGVDCTGRSVIQQADGRLVVAGEMETAVSSDGSTADFALARYNSNGSLDASFGSGGIVSTPVGSGFDLASSVIVQPDGKLVAAGYSTVSGIQAIALVRYNSNGSLDTSFGSGGKVLTSLGSGNCTIEKVVLQPDGKLVVGGSYLVSYPGNFFLARYNSNGMLDTTFGSGGTVTTDFFGGEDQGYGLVLQADGKLVMAGCDYNSDFKFAMARYNSDGSLDNSFGTSGKVTTAYNFARDLALQTDGRLVAAGYAYNGNSNVFALARYNPDGSLDTQEGSPTTTPTITVTSTVTRSATITPTRTVSATVTQTPTVTRTSTISPTRTVSATITRTSTITRTATITPTRTVSATITRTGTITRTFTRTTTFTPTPTRSVTFTGTPTTTRTVTSTMTPLPTPLNETFNYSDDVPPSSTGQLPPRWTDYTLDPSCAAYLKYASTDGLAELSAAPYTGNPKVLSPYQTLDLSRNHIVEVTVNSVPNGLFKFGVYSRNGGWTERILSSPISSPGTYTVDILDTGWTGITNLGVELLADSGNTPTAILDSVRIRGGSPAPIGWVDDFLGTAGYKPIGWQDDSTTVGFGAKLVNTGGQAKLTRTNSSTWGKALSPTWRNCNVGTYPIVEVCVTSITAHCTWKVGIQEVDGAWQYWDLTPSLSSTGVFQLNYAQVTGWSGLHNFNVQLIVENEVGQGITVDWVRISSNSTPTPTCTATSIANTPQSVVAWTNSRFVRRGQSLDMYSVSRYRQSPQANIRMHYKMLLGPGTLNNTQEAEAFTRSAAEPAQVVYTAASANQLALSIIRVDNGLLGGKYYVVLLTLPELFWHSSTRGINILEEASLPFQSSSLGAESEEEAQTLAAQAVEKVQAFMATTTCTPVPDWMRAGEVTAFPNPARGKVTFAYRLVGGGKVAIDIYRLSGERVARIEERQDGGSGQTLTTAWEAAGVAPGIYFCRIVITGGDGKEILNVKKKVALVR